MNFSNLITSSKIPKHHNTILIPEIPITDDVYLRKEFAYETLLLAINFKKIYISTTYEKCDMGFTKIFLTVKYLRNRPGHYHSKFVAETRVYIDIFYEGDDTSTLHKMITRNSTFHRLLYKHSIEINNLYRFYLLY